VRTADIRRTFTDPRPLYAAAGAGDLAVEKLRKLVPARMPRLRGELKAEPQAVRERIGHLPDDVRALPEKTQAFARGRLDQASHGYADLAERGRSVVDRLRRQKPTPQPAEHVKITGRRAPATRTRKGTAGTTRAAKAAGGEAQKTGESAVAAAADAAATSGD